ncbi:fimbria/pilus periplasmic chaperone [Enterobacter hormaechei]|nr:fimbria/pilus periplasmic chaperone [Enterobacter hormaechei]
MGPGLNTSDRFVSFHFFPSGASSGPRFPSSTSLRSGVSCRFCPQKNRESVFYFNLREIPPKNSRPNMLTLAMQTRRKVFFRPVALKVDPISGRRSQDSTGKT